MSKNVRDVPDPVNSNKSRLRLASEQCEGLGNERKPRGNVDKKEDCHDEIEDEAEDFKETLVQVEIFQDVVDRGHEEWDEGDRQGRCTPKLLFEWSWVGKVPSDAVKSAKNDAEESEYDHAGVLVTLRDWCIEGRDVFGTRGYGVGGDDAEDGGEDEGDKKEESEEGEEQDGG